MLQLQLEGLNEKLFFKSGSLARLFFMPRHCLVNHPTIAELQAFLPRAQSMWPSHAPAMFCTELRDHATAAIQSN